MRAGSTLREKGGELADILSVCQHPDFSTTTVDYDLAVLILSRSLPPSDAIKTISYGPIDFDIAEGTMATITGWGLLSWNGSFPDILQVASVPKYDDAVCEDIYKNLTDRMFCFGHEDGRQDSCRVNGIWAFCERAGDCFWFFFRAIPEGRLWLRTFRLASCLLGRDVGKSIRPEFM